jgi:uncharacterized protein
LIGVSWRIVVSDLLPRMGSARDVDISDPVADLGTSGAAVPPGAPVRAQIHLERIPDGLVARGEITARYGTECARCLEPIEGSISAHVDELFEPAPVEGETYLLDHDHIDLEALVRDAVMLELPKTPLCRADCAGLCALCGANRNEVQCDCVESAPDPRWAALEALLPDPN